MDVFLIALIALAVAVAGLALYAILHGMKLTDVEAKLQALFHRANATTPVVAPVIPATPPYDSGNVPITLHPDTPSAPAPAPSPPTAAPSELLASYIDRDDLMKAIGAAALSEAVELDGAQVHNGFGPPAQFWTQPNGNVTRTPPVQQPVPNDGNLQPQQPLPPPPAVAVTPAGIPRINETSRQVRLPNSRVPQWVAFNTGDYTIGRIGAIEWASEPCRRTLSLHTKPDGLPESIIGPIVSNEITGNIDWFQEGRMPPAPAYAIVKPNIDLFLCITCERDGGTMLVEGSFQRG